LLILGYFLKFRSFIRALQSLNRPFSLPSYPQAALRAKRKCYSDVVCILIPHHPSLMYAADALRSFDQFQAEVAA
jgi:hypothetical protein